LAYRHIDVLYRHVFIDRYTVHSVFRGIIWSRVGYVPRVSSWESLSEFRVQHKTDPDVVDEDARRVKRSSARSTQQQKRQAKAKRWNPEVADYSYDEEEQEDDYNYSEDEGFHTPIDSDVTMSFFSEEESDFEGQESDTGSRWSGDSQSISEMEDIRGHWGQQSLPDDGSKAISYNDIVYGNGYFHGEESSSEWEDQTDLQKRGRSSSDGGYSAREWSTPSPIPSGSVKELNSDQSSTPDGELGSSDESEPESAEHSTHSRWDYVTETKMIPTTQSEDPRYERQQSSSNVSTTPSEYEYEYSSDRDAQHTRKLYALSRCRVLTLSDRYVNRDGYGSLDSYSYRHSHNYGYGYHTDRYRDRQDHDDYIDQDYPHPLRHSHTILHNGKAHLLLAGIETLRTVLPWFSHPTETTGIENICHRGRSCPFVNALSPLKVVHRNVGRKCGSVSWGKTLNELVLFFPFAGWLPDHVTGRQDEGLSNLSRGAAKACKIIFGPYVETDYPSRSKLRLDADSDEDWFYHDRPIRQSNKATFKNWTLADVAQILYHASIIAKNC